MQEWPSHLASEVLGADQAVDAAVLAGQAHLPGKAAAKIQATLLHCVLVRQDAVGDHHKLGVQVPGRPKLQALEDQRVPASRACLELAGARNLKVTKNPLKADFWKLPERREAGWLLFMSADLEDVRGEWQMQLKFD
jgi:hypothetical protein